MAEDEPEETPPEVVQAHLFPGEPVDIAMRWVTLVLVESDLRNAWPHHPRSGQRTRRRNVACLCPVSLGAQTRPQTNTDHSVSMRGAGLAADSAAEGRTSSNQSALAGVVNSVLRRLVHTLRCRPRRPCPRQQRQQPDGHGRNDFLHSGSSQVPCSSATANERPHAPDVRQVPN